MSDIDIFSSGSSMNEANALTGTWAKWPQIGAAVQGTYIGFVESQDPKGNPQRVYRLRQSNGEIVNVGIKEGRKQFRELMGKVEIGQIIGIKFTKVLPARMKGFNDTKILEIFANSEVRDEKFLKDQKIIESMKNNDGGAPAHDEVSETDDEPFTTKGLTDEDKIRTIGEFATVKLGVTDPAIMKDKVMEATGLAFIPANLDQILNHLRMM